MLLPHPASTDPVAVSVPVANDIDRLPATTPAPSFTVTPDNCVSKETPVKLKTETCSAAAVPNAEVTCNESNVTKLSATTLSVPKAVDAVTPVTDTVIELCWPQKPCPHVPHSKHLPW